MAKLSRLENNFEKDYRHAFEDMVTHMLIAEFALPHAPLRRKNQARIEADPVERDDGRSFAYQAKYLDAKTDPKTMEGPFKDAIREAHDKGATDLVLYLNKRLTQNTQTREQPAWEQNVDDEAMITGVKLHWRELSQIETMLDDPNRPDYGRIRDMYLCGSRGEENVVGFYRDVCERFFGDTGGELYGNVPLSECYIEPTVDAKGKYGIYLSARDWIESFVVGGGSIAVLCGEPGHGKTSLCRKAVTDFYKKGWLAGRVPNVFCFSLNPANTDALANDSLDLYALLSWGLDRKDQGHKIKTEDCQDALVFLDAFDELLEWYPRLDLEGFLRNHVARFQRDTGAHVIVTTRSIVVKSNTSALRIGRGNKRNSVSIVRLQPITKKEQLCWIERYARHLQGMLACDTNVEKELADLEDYAKRYAKLGDSGDLRDVLGIPIIFRMVVAARYLPQGGESIVHMYDYLFDATWERHAHKDADSASDSMERLSRHALRVYADDADTTAVDSILKYPWLFAFYTTHQGRMRVGFLHRSFYQHFLAHEVVSWFKQYADRDCREYDDDTFRNDLSYLARRRLDETTLAYIRDIHNSDGNKGSLDDAFAKAYEVLKETDGILPLPNDERDVAQIKSLTPLERANNVFWNVIAICGTCNHEVTTENVNVRALRTYDLSGCALINAKLRGIDLRRADLSGANLWRADLRGAILGRADLGRADLRGADLRGTDLWGANLGRADLRRADLEGAILRRADLGGADLGRADLRGAIL